MQKVLVVKDQAEFLEWVEQQLSAPGVEVLTVARADEALELFDRTRPDLVIAHCHLEPFNGLELLGRLRQLDSNALVVMTGAYPTTQMVIESMKLGAFDFVREESVPFNLKVVAEEALQSQLDLKGVTESKSELTVEQHHDSLVGGSAPMQEVFKLIGRSAPSEAPVMITGESGSGKELVARAVHQYSSRTTKSFVAINCAALPENLLESELFGHEKGAFTGAWQQRVGRFEQCDGGTLFLDEIGDMPLTVQSKILRVIQEGEFNRVGGNRTLKTDVRIVAATNKNLEEEVSKRCFREDLLYRLNVVRIHLPPLRERTGDIHLLAEYFLQRIAAQRRLPKLRLSEDAVRVLERYEWPGNVRELENSIQRAVVMATTGVLLPKDIPLGTATSGGAESGLEKPAPAGQLGLPGSKEDHLTVEQAMQRLLEEAEGNPDLALLPWLEREFTAYAMNATGGNQVRAARMLGVTRATLRKRLERFGITSRQGL